MGGTAWDLPARPPSAGMGPVSCPPQAQGGLRDSWDGDMARAVAPERSRFGTVVFIPGRAELLSWVALQKEGSWGWPRGRC